MKGMEGAVDRLAEAMHAAWRLVKLRRGHTTHVLHGKNYDLGVPWASLESDFREFDREIAREVLRGWRDVFKWRKGG